MRSRPRPSFAGAWMGAALVVLFATLARATPFFFCESLPDPPGQEDPQGWGSDTPGAGPQPTVIHVGPAPAGCDPVPPPTQADLIAAIHAANATPNPKIVFPPNATIEITKTDTMPLPPPLTANYVTIEGNGATLRGDTLPIDSSSGRLLEIQGHDVIVRNLHFRNGGNDNLRIQGPNAYNILVSHIASTGAGDDGVSISNRCTTQAGATACESTPCDPSKPFDTAAPHHVTIQYSFFAGNTRSLFVKANNPATRVDNVSVHHNWFTKQWVRGPFVDKV